VFKQTERNGQKIQKYKGVGKAALKTKKKTAKACTGKGGGKNSGERGWCLLKHTCTQEKKRGSGGNRKVGWEPQPPNGGG